ncbi:AMP-binding protein [Tumebacillus flagellatus]|uniref:AMP-dependent synthetase/ligase domain-containing protein n=1 Tax=Tumebacillus flagellatus TaxID=1157490 RepID=A0A074LNN8_9BACL|nr:AMP-binding protein [Tumebacillus flagellatus]KEO83771.1 hypothetical protein EL26_07580 [Tumebacillus flagellatus]
MEQTLVDLLRRRAKERPGDRVTIGRHNANEVLGSATYAQLDERARAVGALLQGFRAKGERVLLLYAQGPAYLTSMLGCLYAGAVAVAVSAPREMRNLGGLEAAVDLAKPTVVLTTSLLLNSVRDVLRDHPDSVLKTVRWVATDAVPVELGGKWQDAGVHGETAAYVETASDRLFTHNDLLNSECLVDDALLVGALGFQPAE